MNNIYIRKNLDISGYFVVGPENTKGRDMAKMIRDVVEVGYTCIQIRSKTASAMELIELAKRAATEIESLGKSKNVALLINDRLDVILAAREAGIKVDGIHVGQKDIPVAVCRKYLGKSSIVGLSASKKDLFQYIKSVDVSDIDYFGAGPLQETMTKKDCEVGDDGKIITRTFQEIEELGKISPIPVVIGGGVKLEHIPDLAKTGIDGFFVVSAISEAENPKMAAKQLIDAWNENK